MLARIGQDLYKKKLYNLQVMNVLYRVKHGDVDAKYGVFYIEAWWVSFMRECDQFMSDLRSSQMILADCFYIYLAWDIFQESDLMQALTEIVFTSLCAMGIHVYHAESDVLDNMLHLLYILFQNYILQTPKYRLWMYQKFPQHKYMLRYIDIFDLNL